MRMKRRPDAPPIGFKRCPDCDGTGGEYWLDKVKIYLGRCHSCNGQRFIKTQTVQNEEDFTEWNFWREVGEEVAKDEAQGCTSQVHRGREDQIW